MSGSERSPFPTLKGGGTGEHAATESPERSREHSGNTAGTGTGEIENLWQLVDHWRTHSRRHERRADSLRYVMQQAVVLIDIGKPHKAREKLVARLAKTEPERGEPANG